MKNSPVEDENGKIRPKFVIKIGSNVLMGEDGGKIHEAVRKLASSVHQLMKSGAQVVLVSSGAIALGRIRLGAAAQDAEIPLLFAIGQSALTGMYERAFRELGVLSAQVLVTNDDVRDAERMAKLCRTLEHSMNRGFAAILNENDAATHWAGVKERAFGDNDMLAAILSAKLKADWLILMTDVDGVFTAHPSSPEARLVRNLAEFSDNGTAHTGHHGRGGMKAKVTAARYAVKHGCQRAAIVNGRRPAVLLDILRGNTVGTTLERTSADE